MWEQQVAYDRRPFELMVLEGLQPKVAAKYHSSLVSGCYESSPPKDVFRRCVSQASPEEQNLEKEYIFI